MPTHVCVPPPLFPFRCIHISTYVCRVGKQVLGAVFSSYCRAVDPRCEQEEEEEEEEEEQQFSCVARHSPVPRSHREPGRR